jgi:predicted transcriptional regulator
MPIVKATKLIAHYDVYGSDPKQWTVGDGPEMGPGEDIYLFGPHTRRGYINIDGDDVRIEIVHDNERKPPQIYHKTLAEIAEFMTGKAPSGDSLQAKAGLHGSDTISLDDLIRDICEHLAESNSKYRAYVAAQVGAEYIDDDHAIEAISQALNDSDADAIVAVANDCLAAATLLTRTASPRSRLVTKCPASGKARRFSSFRSGKT